MRFEKHKELKTKIQLAHKHKLKCSSEVHDLAQRVHNGEILDGPDFEKLSFEMDVILEKINEPSPDIVELLGGEAPGDNIGNAGNAGVNPSSPLHHSSDFADAELESDGQVNTDVKRKSVNLHLSVGRPAKICKCIGVFIIV